jgi:repressor LexA
MSGLTARQRDVVRAVADLTARRGYPPTYAEIAWEIGCSSTGSIAEHIENLRRAGVLDATPREQRSVHLAPHIAVSRGGRIATIHPVSTNAPRPVHGRGGAQGANDCEESLA